MPDIRRFRMISTDPAIIEPNGRRLIFDPATFHTRRLDVGSVPLLKDHVSGTGRIAGRVRSLGLELALMDPGVFGMVEVFADQAADSARDVRRLLDAGHRGASIRFDSTRQRYDKSLKATRVYDWEVVHLAIVSEGADPMAGPELSNNDQYTSITVDLELVPMEELDMGDENKQGGTAVQEAPAPTNDFLTGFGPVIANSVAEGVQQGLQAEAKARAEAEARAREEAAAREREDELARREAEVAAREQALVEAEAEDEDEDMGNDLQDRHDRHDMGDDPTSDTDMESPSDNLASVADLARIREMADIAAGQDRYDEEAVRDLQMEAVSVLMPANEFLEKLKTLSIQPDRRSPIGVDPTYDIGTALMEMRRGRVVKSGYEHDISDEILNKTQMHVGGGNVLAIPLSIIREQFGADLAYAVNNPGGPIQDLNTSRGGTDGTDSAGNAVITDNAFMIRRDVPDPLNILPLVNEVPSTPGDTRIVRLDVPKPGMVAEPGDTGYAKTGDSWTDTITLTPKILVEKLLVTRLANVSVPMLLTNIMMIGLARMNEVKNEQMLIGTGASNQVKGAWSYADGGVINDGYNGDYDKINAISAVANTAAITDVIVTNAIDRMFAFMDSSKRIICHPNLASALRKIARPAAVGEFYAGPTGAGMIDGVGILRTEYLSAGRTKNANALIAPLNDMYLKNWDDAVFISTRYIDGNEIMTMEMFWDAIIAHPAYWTKIPQS